MVQKKNQERYIKNKEIRLIKQKEYYQINKNEKLNYQINYSKLNKNKINIQSKKRREKDPAIKLRNSCSSLIRYILKGSKNNSSILLYLPYTMQELKTHLESLWEPWMTWENYGMVSKLKRTWQIDHIVPQSLLPYSSMEDENFKKCWALENLRPLDSLENIKKGNKLIKPI